jgi:hypothetical protein
MAPAALRLAALRRPRRARQIAMALWIAWAAVVWNVVFDRVIVVAGRQYVAAATQAARAGGPYLRSDDWMRPATVTGLWAASLAGGAILAVGIVAVRVAARRTSQT